ncbi:MAG: tetratricopeptide repeat protein [Nannocystaceae bacterium]|nr:tetratricopeptide repeat protein [Nannocystaceae bacterium]
MAARPEHDDAADPGTGRDVGRYVTRGGPGREWVAFDPELDREVVLERAEGVDPDRLAALRAKARALAVVVHPVLVRVHDVVVERGVATVVSERVRGEPLRHWLSSSPSWSRRIASLRVLADGLLAAHAAGVAHGGLEPAVVQVDEQDCPRVSAWLRVIAGADAAGDTVAFAELALLVLGGAGAGGRRHRVIAALQRGTRAGGATLQQLRGALTQREPGRVPWAVLAVAVALAAVAIVAGTPMPAADPTWCTVAASQLDGVWNDDVRARLRSRLDEVGAGFGHGLGDRIDGALDDFAQTWRAAQQQRCAAQAPDPAASVCLYQQFEGFRTLVEVLLEADAAAVAGADGAIAGLGAPGSCLQPAAGPWRAFAGGDEVRANLVAAELLRELGRYVQSQVAAERALADAVVARDDAAASEAHLALALALLAQEREPEGERSLHDAFTTALAAGSDTVVARAAAELAHRLAKRRKVDQAQTWIEHARAALSRVDDPRVRARVAAVEGRVAMERSDFAEAEAAYRNALALAVALEPRDLATELHARQGIAIARGRQGDRDGAIALLRTNVEQTRARYGDDHPDLGRQMNSVATQLAAQGLIDDAIAQRRRARDILMATLGESHGDTLAATGALATDLGLAGRHTEAVAILRAALPLSEQRFGRDDDRTTSLLGELGMAEATAGDLDDAIVHLRDAVTRVEATDRRDGIALLAMTTNLAATLMFAERHAEARALFEALVTRTERTLGRDHPQLVPVLLGAARSARALGEYDPAIAELERARLLLSQHEERIDRRARVDADLAEVLWRSGRDRPRAVTLMRAAHQGLLQARAAGHEALSEDIAELEQWLQDHADAVTDGRARR